MRKSSSSATDWEAQHAFESPQNDLTRGLSKRRSSWYGCQQMVGLHLEELLIRLRRAELIQKRKLVSSTRQCSENELYDMMVDFIDEHICEQITIELLCKHFSASKTAIKQLFRQRAECGVIEYVRRARIEEAKRLIREKDLTFTAIASAGFFLGALFFALL
jgi:YesN/AraC family two-component response regulator